MGSCGCVSDALVLNTRCMQGDGIGRDMPDEDVVTMTCNFDNTHGTTVIKAAPTASFGNVNGDHGKKWRFSVVTT